MTIERKNGEKKEPTEEKKNDKEVKKVIVKLLDETDENDSFEEAESDSVSSDNSMLEVGHEHENYEWEDTSDSFDGDFEFEFENTNAKRFKRDTEEKIALKESVFTARCKIKLFKMFDNISIVVDSFNMIYVFGKGFSDFKTHRISNFKISDFEKIKNFVYFTSEVSAFMYRLDIENNKIEIFKKNMPNIKKVVRLLEKTNKYLAMGDKLMLFNENLVKENEFTGQFLCVTADKLNKKFVALKKTGELMVFDENLIFIKEVALENKFAFRNIFSTDTNIAITTETGVVFLDQGYEIKKELKNTETEPLYFLYTNDFIFYTGSIKHSFKVLKNNDKFEPFENFPFATVQNASCLATHNDKIYITVNKQILEYNLKNE